MDGLILEVTCSLGTTPLLCKQFDAWGTSVALASHQGWIWSIGPHQVGWVSARAARWLRWAPWGLSHCEMAPVGDFIVTDAEIGPDLPRPVWHRTFGGCVVDVPCSWHPRILRSGVPAHLAFVPGARFGHDSIWIELQPGWELWFDAGGLCFRSRLTAAAQPATQPGWGTAWIVGALVALVVSAAAVAMRNPPIRAEAPTVQSPQTRASFSSR